ncbi:MAG: class I SAM-dependent methyltransferase [Actinobacteria bacterium]|nr:class I SAM-dependent methyltransferase [Actinomycetota bacterium]
MADELTFETIYAQAGDDLAGIPWASLAPMPALVQWLDGQPPVTGARALVVACGLGDDAEEVSRRGCRVTAFDLVPAAIAHCRARFPGSAVDYRVADVFRLPDDWRRAFDLVVEIRTLQSLPVSERATAAASIAGMVAPGGRVFVHGLGRRDDDPPGRRPWPLSPHDLRAFTSAGLTDTELAVQPRSPGPDERHVVTAVYTRPAL